MELHRAIMNLSMIVRKRVCLVLATRTIIHYLPSNLIPPRLQEPFLPPYTPVPQPHMFPSIDTKYWDNFKPSRCHNLQISTMSTEGPDFIANFLLLCPLCPLYSAYRRGVLSSHVDRLHAKVRASVRGAGDVGRKDAHVAALCANKPDEARAEHGICSVDEFGTEGVDGGEVVDDLAFEGFGDGTRVRRLIDCVKLTIRSQEGIRGVRCL